MDRDLPAIIGAWERFVRRLSWPSTTEMNHWLEITGVSPTHWRTATFPVIRRPGYCAGLIQELKRRLHERSLFTAFGFADFTKGLSFRASAVVYDTLGSRLLFNFSNFSILKKKKKNSKMWFNSRRNVWALISNAAIIAVGTNGDRHVLEPNACVRVYRISRTGVFWC